MSEVIDLTGQKFGRLIVIKRAKSDKSGQAMWECQCECGKTAIVRGYCLRSGRTLSCGCLGGKKLIDLVGKKFGKLTVISRAENDSKGRARWNCQCECGNFTIASGKNLRCGDTKSCGCIRSIGESNLQKILEENNIFYKKEYTFNDLKDKKSLKFDFAIIDNSNNLQYLIEFDGRQHWDKKDGWYNEDTIKHDLMKNKYCKEHNIPLIRIPYSKRDTMKIEDLMLKTSKFLI